MVVAFKNHGGFSKQERRKQSRREKRSNSSTARINYLTQKKDKGYGEGAWERADVLHDEKILIEITERSDLGPQATKGVTGGGRKSGGDKQISQVMGEFVTISGRSDAKKVWETTTRELAKGKTSIFTWRSTMNCDWRRSIRW